MNSENTHRFVSRLTRNTLAYWLVDAELVLKILLIWDTENFGSNSISISFFDLTYSKWGFLRAEFGEFVELMPASQQRIDES